ncbi:MAG: hypothetical protein AMJ43_10740 [Coxiella sp. DG_40]|nr:MAG: hypothetical protein AMJ43_10740 [Coxiella sp. DG_40]
MEIQTRERIDIKFMKASSPLPLKRVWQIESFLLKIFEYGDYSFRSTLSGSLSSRLQSTLFVAQKGNKILAAAGSLYSLDNPTVAILGPVCVAPEYRRKGLATELCSLLLAHTEAQGTKAVYLGIKPDNPAVHLYSKLGFDKHTGVVMRKLFCSEQQLLERYSPKKTNARRMGWQDFASVSALLCEPADIYSFDFNRGIFSAKYIEPDRFLSVFPKMMKSFEKNGGFANILETVDDLSIVGIAQISLLASTIQSHMAVLDFFVLDNFLDRACNLVRDTIRSHFITSHGRVVSIKNGDFQDYKVGSKRLAAGSSKRLVSYCLACDTKKKQILRLLGAKQYSVLSGYVNLNGELIDVLIFEL